MVVPGQSRMGASEVMRPSHTYGGRGLSEMDIQRSGIKQEGGDRPKGGDQNRKVTHFWCKIALFLTFSEPQENFLPKIP